MSERGVLKADNLSKHMTEKHRRKHRSALRHERCPVSMNMDVKLPVLRKHMPVKHTNISRNTTAKYIDHMAVKHGNISNTPPQGKHKAVKHSKTEQSEEAHSCVAQGSPWRGGGRVVRAAPPPRARPPPPCRGAPSPLTVPGAGRSSRHRHSPAVRRHWPLAPRASSPAGPPPWRATPPHHPPDSPADRRLTSTRRNAVFLGETVEVLI